MRIAFLAVILSAVAIPAAEAKGSPETNEEFRKYRSLEYPLGEGTVAATALSSLLKNQDRPTPTKNALSLLATIRDQPDKNLISPLKELWKLNHKFTFRVTSPDGWGSIRTEDYAKMLCDEIKVLILSMGGTLDDIEPIDEKNTASLYELRLSLIPIKDTKKSTLTDLPDLRTQTRKLSAILKTCRFGASNEDETRQLAYIFEIIQILGEDKAWPSQVKITNDDPIVEIFDELLGKTLPHIDENWSQEPPKPKNQEPRSLEKILQLQKESLVGYQQMNLRRIRDLILTDISNLIEARKSDDAFKQQMLKRFANDDACRKFIKNQLNSEK